MVISEEKFREHLQRKETISPKVRKKLNETYESILLDKVERKKGFKPEYLFSLVIVMLVVLLFSVTPLGEATMNLLRFGYFTSETLNENGFVTKGIEYSEDQDILIGVEEFYTDQNALGIHFSIEFPKESKFLNEDLEQYVLKFIVKDEKSGEVFIDFLGEEQTEATTNFEQTIYSSQFMDRTNNRLDIDYRVHFHNAGSFPKLNDIVVEISGISAIYRNSVTYGESQVKGESLKGNWQIPVHLSQITEFPTIEFESSTSDSIHITEAIAYPTTFTVKIPIDEMEKFPTYSGENTIQLKANDRLYPYRKADIIDDNTDKYLELTFDYSGYDQFSEIYIVIDHVEEIRLMSK